MSKPLAESGEWVTCPNGHRIAQISRIVVSGEPLSPDQFTNWQVPPGATGETIAPCPKCGDAFVRRVGGIFGGHSVHIEGRGWVPK